MAKKQPDLTPSDQHWVCEACDGVHLGVNPPDECYCGNRYFDNLADTLKERSKATIH